MSHKPKAKTGLAQGTLFKPRPPELRITFEDLFPGEDIFDNFAGGGGISTGTVQATGRPVTAALNHDPEAIAMHMANHPETKHYCEDITMVDPREVCRGRRVGLAWFAPDCTHHSKAKGAAPRNNKSRGIAKVVIDWANLPAPMKPRLIMVENVEEFEDWGPLLDNGRPDKARLGEYFRPWLAALVDAGYSVEFRCMVAADLGAPTTRNRFFLVARRDRLPIIWPEPTHGPGRAHAWKTAATHVIDFSIPTVSIFGRPYGRYRPLVPASLRRIGLGAQRFVFEHPDPFIIPAEYQGGDAFATPFIIRHGHYSKKTGAGLVPGKGMPGVFRGQSIERPVGTVTTRDDKNLVMPIITKHYGGKVGHQTPGQHAAMPLGAVTARDHHAVSALAFERLPLPTVTANGNHLGEVRAFLVKYYGSGGRFQGQDARTPLHTVTTHDRFGIVAVKGEPYQLVDIGTRMFVPRELFRAQDFPDDYIIDVEFNGKPLTQEAQTRCAGNAAPPCYARSLVRANATGEARAA